MKGCKPSIMYKVSYEGHGSIFTIANLILKLFCIIWGLFGAISGLSHHCEMGNDKNKKKRESKNPRSEKMKLVGLSTPKQRPNYPHTRSVTRTRHTHHTLLTSTIVPDVGEPQEVVSTPALLPDVTIFNPKNLQDLQGAHTLLNLHHTTHHQSFAVAQTPHERAAMEVMLDDSEDDMSVEPSGSLWIPEVNRVVGGDLGEDESAIFAQTPRVSSFRLNAASVPALLAISHAPAPVKKSNRAQAKKRVAIEEVVEEEVQEGSSKLTAK